MTVGTFDKVSYLENLKEGLQEPQPDLKIVYRQCQKNFKPRHDYKLNLLVSLCYAYGHANLVCSDPYDVNAFWLAVRLLVASIVC